MSECGWELEGKKIGVLKEYNKKNPRDENKKKYHTKKKEEERKELYITNK